jgi:hypothetical protein
MADQAVGSEYAEHLTDADLDLLAGLADMPGAGPGSASRVAWLRRNPAVLPGLLGEPRVFGAVFEPPKASGRVEPQVSPFLTFAVAVQRAVAELGSLDYVSERSGFRQKVPLFDAPELRDFLDSRDRQLFLAELLASFTRIASGRYPVRVRGQQRTRRFSDATPVALAGLLDAVPEAERPGIYRRLGDVTLFLTGVFPDYAASGALGPVNAGRLLRAARISADEQERLAEVPALELLEHLGSRWYRAACGLAPVRTARLAVVAEVAGRFRQARRVLNYIADRWLFPSGAASWFAPPS